MTYFMWLGAAADEAAIEAETIAQLLAELPYVDEADED